MPVALITGASRGFGRALARALARQGWSLALAARGADALEQVSAELSPLTRITALPGDIADPEHARQLVEAAARLGPITALINNAGSLGPSPLPPLLEARPEDLRAVYEIGALAPLALIRLAAPHLAPNARIVNVSSDAAVEGYPGWGVYGQAKAALDALSRVLAAEHPEWRVYALDPGDMRTQMHQQAYPGEDISDRPEPEASVPGTLRLLQEALPSGRYSAAELGAGA